MNGVTIDGKRYNDALFTAMIAIGTRQMSKDDFAVLLEATARGLI
jgi:hypothetical protein